MRKISRSKSRSVTKYIVAALTMLCIDPAFAGSSGDGSNGFSLPGVSLPSGTDEVRAADGTSCRSAVGGNGAYVDMGMIGAAANPADNSSYYGRVVIPLGKAPKRVDCTKLYELEVERLKLELELAKAGLGRTENPDIATDTTETSSVSGEEADPGFGDPQVEAPVVPEAQPAAAKKGGKPVKQASAKPVKKKIGNANWDDEGWTEDGRKEQ